MGMHYPCICLDHPAPSYLREGLAHDCPSLVIWSSTRPLGEALLALALFCGLGLASRFVPAICFSMLAVGIFLPLV